MAINTYLSKIESKKQTNNQSRNRFRCTEKSLTLPAVSGVGGWLKKVKGLSTNWQLQNSHVEVKYSLGNIVNNIGIQRELH